MSLGGIGEFLQDVWNTKAAPAIQELAFKQATSLSDDEKRATLELPTQTHPLHALWKACEKDPQGLQSRVDSLEKSILCGEKGLYARVHELGGSIDEWEWGEKHVAEDPKRLKQAIEELVFSMLSQLKQEEN